MDGTSKALPAPFYETDDGSSCACGRLPVSERSTCFHCGCSAQGVLHHFVLTLSNIKPSLWEWTLIFFPPERPDRSVLFFSSVKVPVCLTLRPMVRKCSGEEMILFLNLPSPRQRGWLGLAWGRLVGQGPCISMMMGTAGRGAVFVHRSTVLNCPDLSGADSREMETKTIATPVQCHFLWHNAFCRTWQQCTPGVWNHDTVLWCPVFVVSLVIVNTM